MAQKPMRDVKLWSPVVRWETRDTGEILVWREDPLGPYPDKINERLIHWANEAPDRVWMADRRGTGPWKEVTYGEALKHVRAVGQFLLNQGLSTDRPLIILSENSLEHALMALGATREAAEVAAGRGAGGKAKSRQGRY